MKFHKDHLGINDLAIEKGKHVIADFLSSDIQGGPYNMKLFLTACEDVMSGKTPEWEATGNAHTVIIKPDGVSIENAYTYDEIKLSSIAEFEWYLKQWERLITTGEEFTIESPFK